MALTFLLDEHLCGPLWQVILQHHSALWSGTSRSHDVAAKFYQAPTRMLESAISLVVRR